MTSIALVGCTGLVGSNILTTLASLPNISAIHAISRRSPPSIQDPSTLPNLQLHLSDSAAWTAKMASLSPPPTILFSGLATTKGQAGSFEAQYKIDHDLNLEVARAAHAAGTRVYVLISAAKADSTSRIPYTRMKGEIEEAINAIGFDQVIFLRPGLIVGSRGSSRMAETALSWTANAMGRYLGNGAKDFWAQDAEVIARAAVSTGFQAAKGKKAEDLGLVESAKKDWILGAPEMIRLGRTDWPAFEESQKSGSA